MGNRVVEGGLEQNEMRMFQEGNVSPKDGGLHRTNLTSRALTPVCAWELGDGR